MAETNLTCARQSFAQLKTELVAIFTLQSEFEMIHDEEAPGVRRFKVRFDASPADPRLLIVKEGKPNLLPGANGEPEVEKTDLYFDAF